VFENRMLSRIFGSTREVKGCWRKLHNEELLNFTLHQILHNQIKEDEMSRASSMNGSNKKWVKNFAWNA
jgi:hypothetical protein